MWVDGQLAIHDDYYKLGLTAEGLNRGFAHLVRGWNLILLKHLTVNGGDHWGFSLHRFDMQGRTLEAEYASAPHR